jgi:hypothetical protein
MTENEISFKIRGAIFKVYNTYPGLFESVWKCFCIVINKVGLKGRKANWFTILMMI